MVQCESADYYWFSNIYFPNFLKATVVNWLDHIKLTVHGIGYMFSPENQPLNVFISTLSGQIVEQDNTVAVCLCIRDRNSCVLATFWLYGRHIVMNFIF